MRSYYGRCIFSAVCATALLAEWRMRQKDNWQNGNIGRMTTGKMGQLFFFTLPLSPKYLTYIGQLTFGQ